MKTHPVIATLQKHKKIKDILALIEKHDFTSPFTLQDTTPSLKNILTALLWFHGDNPMIIITSDSEQASETYFDLSSMIDDEYLHLLALPEHQLHLLHEDIDPNILKTVDTILGFTRLSKGILIVPKELLKLTYPPPSSLEKNSISIKRGDNLPFKNFTNSLMLHGFERKDYVSQQGEISIRGGIVDIFPMGHDLPIRIEFWGDEIESSI